MPETVASKPPTFVELVWEHDLVLAGAIGDNRVVFDSAGVAGPSPVQTLAFALAACTAMDVVHILRKGRQALRGLKVSLTGQRAQDEPRRFTAIELHFTITGDIADGPVQRAIDLSRDKYCSVWHSMRQDIELAVTFKVTEGL
jgi:putative redox protein